MGPQLADNGPLKCANLQGTAAVNRVSKLFTRLDALYQVNLLQGPDPYQACYRFRSRQANSFYGYNWRRLPEGAVVFHFSFLLYNRFSVFLELFLAWSCSKSVDSDTSLQSADELAASSHSFCLMGLYSCTNRLLH